MPPPAITIHIMNTSDHTSTRTSMVRRVLKGCPSSAPLPQDHTACKAHSFPPWLDTEPTHAVAVQHTHTQHTHAPPLEMACVRREGERVGGRGGECALHGCALLHSCMAGSRRRATNLVLDLLYKVNADRVADVLRLRDNVLVPAVHHAHGMHTSVFQFEPGRCRCPCPWYLPCLCVHVVSSGQPVRHGVAGGASTRACAGRCHKLHSLRDSTGTFSIPGTPQQYAIARSL